MIFSYIVNNVLRCTKKFFWALLITFYHCRGRLPKDAF